ncbi:UNVERIFIED_CONTAM: hypothetical protein FKN15_015779 [Acipenser sinensis]
MDSVKMESVQIKEFPELEPLPFTREFSGLASLPIKQELYEMQWKEESEDFKPNIPELEPVRLRECSVVLERICVREQGAGEEGSPNSTQGGGQGDGRSHSECSLAASAQLLGIAKPSASLELGFSALNHAVNSRKDRQVEICESYFHESSASFVAIVSYGRCGRGDTSDTICVSHGGNFKEL